MRIFLVIFFIQASLNSYGQKNDDYQIYIGKLVGISKTAFLNQLDEYDIREDSILNLSPITENIHPIEIRLYENPSGTGIKVCTILYYNDGFKTERFSKLSGGWEKTYKIKDYYPVELIKADSAFAVLVENGIFGLDNSYEYMRDSAKKILTKKGLITSNAFCGTTDGVSYSIQVKVQNVYKLIHFSSSEEAQLLCFPDMDIIRRKKKIVDQLRANPALVKK